MKKILTCFVAVFCLVSAGFAVSWSGVLDNNTELNENHDFSAGNLIQSNGIYLSINAPLSNDGSLKFSAEALYKYKLTSDFKAKTNVFMNILDVDLFKLSGKWNVSDGVVALDAGRFFMSDMSGSVFAQSSDGLYFSYDSIKLKAGAYAGYTGLLNSLNVSMNGVGEQTNREFYRLCPGYVPLAAEVSYKALFETNTIGLQGEYFLPVDKEKNPDKFFGTLSLNGSIGTAGSYSLKGTVGSEKFKNVMLDTALDLSFYLQEKGIANFGCEYISGKQGPFEPFTTVTARKVYNGDSVNGLIIPKAGAIFAQNSIFAGLTVKGILGLPESKMSFQGIDTEVNLVYNLFSDVQIGCDVDAFICTAQKESSKYTATIKASLAF